MESLPLLDWHNLARDREQFLADLRHALANIGFLVLKNVPGFEDEVQQRMFKEVRGFFDAPENLKATADIALSPYFRGWSKVDSERELSKGKKLTLLAQEAFQYGFESEPVAMHDDKSMPLHRRLFRGPNTWPDELHFPCFRENIEELTYKYHRLTHDLGHLICESIGVDTKQFDAYFDFKDPDLGASLNRNLGMSFIPPERRSRIETEFAKVVSAETNAHIDGPPFVAILINDKPGLQVIAGEGKWINAPVTCRTKPGEYPVPVIPGSVVVNSGGLLMHLSKGKFVATLHRVNPMLVPESEDRVSMPFFLLPKMEGSLTPFVSAEDEGQAAVPGHTGIKLDLDRGTNTAVNRMLTFPQCTKRWWNEEYKELWQRVRKEQVTEAAAAYKLAAERGTRNLANRSLAKL